MNQSHHPPGEDRSEYTQYYTKRVIYSQVIEQQRYHHTRETAGQQHPLHRNIDNPAALRDDTA